MAIGPLEKRLTYEDYARLPDDGHRYELLEGELLMTPSPLTRHQEISIRLSSLLFAHLQKHPIGRVLCAPLDVILSSLTVLQPDLVFVLAEHKEIITERAIEGSPDLVVEILSPSTIRRDRVQKRRLYAQHGVSHLWIADPDAKILEIFELQGENYALTGTYGENDPFEPKLFPGLTISLGDVWV
ncbi:MAG: Uma2 family endonuclease [Armatimonadetes bacterium]|nr:Uma2 family endonuclease [Armatimonadota bacterium]